MNDLINAFFGWLIDSIMVFIGITGVPNLLEGFLNDVFLAFQLLDNFDRRMAAGPYHPGMETFVPTGASPYNIEAIFTFIQSLWDTRGYTAAIVKFRNGAGGLRLGRDIWTGGLFTLIYMSRTLMYTDYVEDTPWRITPKEREVTVQVGDGSALEAPLAHNQRLFSGLKEAFHVWTLAPNN